MNIVLHPFLIPSREVARWLDSQPDTWWSAGLDDLLISRLNFPCPNDEVAEVLREIDKNLIVYTDKSIGIEDGQQIDSQVFPLLADTQNRYHNRYFLASWQGSNKKWLFRENKWAAKALTDDSTEDWDEEDEDGSQPED
jgi:hypothetical protein